MSTSTDRQHYREVLAQIAERANLAETGIPPTLEAIKATAEAS